MLPGQGSSLPNTGKSVRSFLSKESGSRNARRGYQTSTAGANDPNKSFTTY